MPFEEIAADVRTEVEAWAQQYEPVHAVAHWDDRQRRGAGNYDAAFENAAEQAELLLAARGTRTHAQNYYKFTPPSSGKIKMNAWRSGPKMYPV